MSYQKITFSDSSKMKATTVKRQLELGTGFTVLDKDAQASTAETGLIKLHKSLPIKFTLLLLFITSIKKIPFAHL